MTGKPTPVVVSVLTKANGKIRARITRDGHLYGRERAFDTLPGALVHCAQMLRVLADEESKG